MTLLTATMTSTPFYVPPTTTPPAGWRNNLIISLITLTQINVITLIDGNRFQETGSVYLRILNCFRRLLTECGRAMLL